MHQITYNPHPKDESFGTITVSVDHVQLQGVLEAVDKREWMGVSGDARNGTKAGSREGRQAG